MRLLAAGKVDPGLICIEDRLANWLAPEVIAERRFQQASDIYALGRGMGDDDCLQWEGVMLISCCGVGTVFWELLAKRLPFEDDTQPVIREKLLQGNRTQLLMGH